MRPEFTTIPARGAAARLARAAGLALAAGLAIAATLALVGCGGAESGTDAVTDPKAQVTAPGATTSDAATASTTATDTTTDTTTDTAPSPRTTDASDADALTARELIDAGDAIGTLLNAERTREAEIIVRRLLERAPAGSASHARVNELAARVFFTHARLPTSELGPEERDALLSEAAACAVRSIAPDERDDARIAFAALLASGGGLHRDAARLFDQALAIAPKPDYLLQAALAALAEGDLARARALLATRRGAAPSDAWNDAIEAEIALAAGESAPAVAAAQRAVAGDRDALEFRMILARALRRDGRAADAARLLSALEPGERAKPALAEQFALALAESGDLSGAARAWDAALAANPADPYVRAETALAFHRAGDTARAAAELSALDAMRGGAAQRRRVAGLMRAKP